VSTRVLSTLWRFPYGLRRISSKTTVHCSSSRLNSTNKASIFEPISREELITKFKSRLRGRQFLSGSSEGGFPAFLAEPRESFSLGVRVNNSIQPSLTELTAKCMEFVEENISHSPSILFRGLPARTAEDVSTDCSSSWRTNVDFPWLDGEPRQCRQRCWDLYHKRPPQTLYNRTAQSKYLTMIIIRPR